MPKTSRAVLTLLALVLTASPVFADIITARHELQKTPDTEKISPIETGVPEGVTLTEQDALYFSRRPLSIQVAGQQNEWYEVSGGLLWILATGASVLWYTHNH